MSEVKKVEAQQSWPMVIWTTPDVETVWTVWSKVDGPGTYYIVPGEVWEEVLSWAEDDQGLPAELAVRIYGDHR